MKLLLRILLRIFPLGDLEDLEDLSSWGSWETFLLRIFPLDDLEDFSSWGPWPHYYLPTWIRKPNGISACYITNSASPNLYTALDEQKEAINIPCLLCSTGSNWTQYTSFLVRKESNVPKLNSCQGLTELNSLVTWGVTNQDVLLLETIRYTIWGLYMAGQHLGKTQQWPVSI